jgi:hypothetical protein
MVGFRLANRAGRDEGGRSMRETPKWVVFHIPSQTASVRRNVRQPRLRMLDCRVFLEQSFRFCCVFSLARYSWASNVPNHSAGVVSHRRTRRRNRCDTTLFSKMTCGESSRRGDSLVSIEFSGRKRATSSRNREYRQRKRADCAHTIRECSSAGRATDF